MRTATAFLLSCPVTALWECSASSGDFVRSCRDTAAREGRRRLSASCFLTPSGQPVFHHTLLQKHPSITLTALRNGRRPVTRSSNNGKLTVTCRNTATLPLPARGRMVLFLVRQNGIVRYQNDKEGIPPHNGGNEWRMLIAVHGNICLICWHKAADIPVRCRPAETASPCYHVFTMKRQKTSLAPAFSLIPNSLPDTQP